MLFFRSDRHCQDGDTEGFKGTNVPENKLMRWSHTTVIRFEEKNIYFGSALQLEHIAITLSHIATDTHFVLKPKTTLILTQE